MRRKVVIALKKRSMGAGTPEPPAKLFRSVFPGGGGGASIAVSPFNANHAMYGTDTGGHRVTVEGFAHSRIHTNGFDKLRSRQGNGSAYSRLFPGRIFMTGGDGTAGVGGVFVADKADDKIPDKWTRLDGKVANSPTLTFDGGNSEPGSIPPPGPYPRQYASEGGIIEIDESSVPDFTFIHVATNSDGAWRIKMRNSDKVAVQQIRYLGTAGLYIRCIKMRTYAPNDAENNYSKIIISAYNNGNPSLPLMCENANTDVASPSLPTSTITNAPQNVECMWYLKAPTGNPITVFCALNTVMFSNDAWTATPSTISFNPVTRTPVQNDGPENNQRWISCWGTHDATNYYISVGTFEGRTSGGKVNTVWIGTVPIGHATPWQPSAILWEIPTFVEQVMDRAGVANKWWLANNNTPTLKTSAAVSGGAVSKTDPSRIYLVSRGGNYRSDNKGFRYYPTEAFGSADHSSIYAYKYYAPGRDIVVTTCGDWSLAGTTDQFATEPKQLLDGTNTQALFENPNTGMLYIGGGVLGVGGGVAPPAGDGNDLYSVPLTRLSATSPVKFEGNVTKHNMNTGAGVGINVGAVTCGLCTISSTNVETLIVGTAGGKGMWYTVDNGANWIKVNAAVGTTHPFSTGVGNLDASQMIWDRTRNMIYVMDRYTQRVWRCTVNANGTISTATCIFSDTWTYNATKDGVGYIDFDEVNDRLWIATLNGVWRINNASAATNQVNTTGNTVATPFATQFPGEFPGVLAFNPTTGAVHVATLNFTSNQIQKYPLNGADGTRFLTVSSPTTAASWTRDSPTCEDWAVTRDAGYRLGYIAPHGISRTADGSHLYVTMQGNGVGQWIV